VKRVLITGAGGFIGRHLVADQLKRGHDVTAVDIRVDALEPLRGNPDLHILQGDFADASLLEDHLPNQDVCFHLASAHLETGVDDNYFWRVNVENLAGFIQRCQDAGVRRFVQCSSVGVFGDLKHPPADEDSPCNPDVPYEKSKLAGEKIVREFAAQYGYPVVIVRPAWVYGPGCPRTARLFRSIKKGSFFFVGDGRTLRHPIYIDDMVQGFEVAATDDRALNDVFIIAGPRPVTLLELTQAIAATLGKPAPSLKIPTALMEPAAAVSETVFGLLGRHAPLTRRSLKFFTGNTAFVTRKAETCLGFKANIDLPEGLRRTYQWMQENGQI
jgi:nucleoside-diphosphate-sugar epimerase